MPDTLTIREKTALEGYDVKIAHYPEEVGADDVNLERCPHCKNAVAPRKAGAVDHCHYCGKVIRTNN